MADNKNRLQTRVPTYHKWVVAQLVGTEGRNEGDVLARIIAYWIKDNETWLAKRGVSVERFLGETGDEHAKGKILRMPDSDSSRE